MKSRYLLSSLGVHFMVAALLSPLVLFSPPSSSERAAVTVNSSEPQKASGFDNEFADYQQLPKIQIEAKRDARPKEINASTDVSNLTDEKLKRRRI